MNAEKNAAAYAAIDKYVHSYLFNRGLLGLEKDACAECHDFFETYKHLYRENGRASLETFACRTADSCLKNILRAMRRQKRRERVASFRLGLKRGDTLDQKKTIALVREALRRLPWEQVEILLWIQEGKSLDDLAKNRQVAKSTFYDRDVKAAKTAFIDIYQKLINERN